MQKFTSAIRVSFWRVAPIVGLLALPSVAPHVRAGAAEAAVEAAAPAGVSAAATTASRTSAAKRVRAAGFRPADWKTSQIGSMNREVFAKALSAAAAAIDRGDVTDPTTLTIIDFSKPSTAKRLWVVDLRSRKLLYEELVAHGRGSGENYATKFSNVAESNRSSLGLFRTAEAYVGKNGYSLRLDGLEPGINDRARARAVVIHGAPYVSAAIAKAQGRIGRSLGCPALRPAITRALIDTVKGGDLVFAYYPDKRWLTSSRYLAAPTVVAAE